MERDALRIAAERNLRCGVVRLPLFVHGHDGSVFVPALVRAAREAGVSAYVGANRYTAVYVDDAARLYALALDRMPAGGALYHADGEQGV